MDSSRLVFPRSMLQRDTIVMMHDFPKILILFGKSQVELAQRPSLEMLQCREMQKREIKHKQVQSIGQIGGSVIKMLASKPKDISSILNPQGMVREPTPTSYPLTCTHGP